MIPIIDTHQHLWDLQALSLDWVKGDKVMDHSYLMSDYLAASKGTGIEQTVYMEVNVNPECAEDEIKQMSVHCASSETPMKKIVIASNIGGSSETIINDKTGLLFETGNPKSLCKKIIQGITMDETSLKIIGNEGRKNIIKKFNVEKMCFSTYSEYKRLLN